MDPTFLSSCSPPPLPLSSLQRETKSQITVTDSNSSTTCGHSCHALCVPLSGHAVQSLVDMGVSHPYQALLLNTMDGKMKRKK